MFITLAVELSNKLTKNYIQWFIHFADKKLQVFGISHQLEILHFLKINNLCAYQKKHWSRRPHLEFVVSIIFFHLFNLRCWTIKELYWVGCVKFRWNMWTLHTNHRVQIFLLHFVYLKFESNRKLLNWTVPSIFFLKNCARELASPWIVS
jgi:hypothetical protein